MYKRQQQLRAENVHALGWWSPEEMRSGQVTFSPRRLASYIADLAETIPSTPIEIAPL